MDILALGSNVGLGKGWFRPETHQSQTFRWVTNDAEIYVATVRHAKHFLQFYLEPGPGLNGAPIELLIQEENDTLARLTVQGRQMFSLTLPAASPSVRRLVLHLQGNGRRSESDSRVLNFRVFKIALFPEPADILPPELDARLGRGWHPLETFEGETFRWAGDEAQIFASGETSRARFALELEPGPGVNLRPFVLQVFSDSGELIVEQEVTTRQLVSLPVVNVLTLKAKDGGRKIPSDDRVMNFRAFAHSTDLRASV